MCWMGIIFLVQNLKGSMSGDARNFNNIEMRTVIIFFFLQGKAPKKIHAILTETLGEHSPSYAVKNWVAEFKRGEFSTSDVPRPGRPKTVTTLEILDEIHKLILEDRRISAKSIAEQTGHLTWAGWVHQSWRFGQAEALRQVGPEMPECGWKTSTVPVVWTTFGIFSAQSKLFPVATGDHGRNLIMPLRPGDKATINRVVA